jgi:hypothetical protein
MWLGVPMRRLVMENWFQIVVRVGSKGQDEHPLTMKCVERGNPDKPVSCADDAPPVGTKFLGAFTANNDGEVFLFVNDAIGLPWQSFYKNNSGKAIVTIEQAPEYFFPNNCLKLVSTDTCLK